MKQHISIAFLLVSQMASAQGALPWGQAVSVPALAAQSDVALFYVAAYKWTGAHTDYDMARQAADAFLTMNPQTPTYVVLGPAAYQTCDDVALPVVSTGSGASATVSIIGYGSNVSSLTKRTGCAANNATFTVRESTTGAVRNALFQGFTVSAGHIDAAACGFYGMSGGTVFDVGCGDAIPGADHEVEFGDQDGRAAGQDYNVLIYNLKAFDTVGAGKGALLTPLWNGSALVGATLVNGGTKQYTQQYTRAQVIGPDLASCTTVPTVTPRVSTVGSVRFPNLPATTYGYVTGITIANPGNCASTGQLYILVQDGVPVANGMKFSNMVMSHAWNLETTASAIYGEAWMPLSGNNTTVGEHIWTNQTIQIAEYASGNKHINAYLDGPGTYGAAIYGHSGSFTNPVFTWDGPTYVGSSGYLLGGAAGAYGGWLIRNSQCTDSSADFVSVTTSKGILSAADTAPSGTTLNDIEACDGTNAINWPTQVNAN